MFLRERPSPSSCSPRVCGCPGTVADIKPPDEEELAKITETHRALAKLRITTREQEVPYRSPPCRLWCYLLGVWTSTSVTGCSCD